MLRINFSISRCRILLFGHVQGPYVDNTRTHLQKVVGDDNVLIVKFADVPGIENSADNFGIYCMYYRQIAEDGIFLGLRRYRFFRKFVLLGMHNLFRSIFSENYLLFVDTFSAPLP